jgi:aminoglycoside phosphotransferase (APT) family kinase protein
VTEESIKMLLKDQYGDFNPVRLFGGFTNDAYLLEGTSPLLVAKVANLTNRDIVNEANCLRLLHDSAFSPIVHGQSETKDVQVTLMEFRRGQNGQFIVDSNDVKRTRELYKRMAETLANSIHAKKYVNSFGIRKSNMNELNLNLDFVPKEFADQFINMIKNVNDTPVEWVLTHGDFGVHNVLLNADGHIIVLEWERAEWGNPLCDISWVCWFTHLHYPEYAKSLNPLFIDEYQNLTPVNLSSDQLKSYCLYRVWKVLNKLDQSPAEVQLEWVRRLKWTLKTDIFHFIC